MVAVFITVEKWKEPTSISISEYLIKLSSISWNITQQHREQMIYHTKVPKNLKRFMLRENSNHYFLYEKV